MGSDFSKQVCCVTCRTCKETTEEASETEPILQTSRETSVCTGRQTSTPAPGAFIRREVLSLSQDQESSGDAAEEKMEICSAAEENIEISSAAYPMGMTEGKEVTWDSSDFLVAPADGQTKGEVKILIYLDNQHEGEKVGDTEERIKPLPRTSEARPLALAAQDVKLFTDKEQSNDQAEAGREGSPQAGINLQEKNILYFIETANATSAGQECGTKPPVETGEGILGRNLPLCAVQVAEETEIYLPAERMEEVDGAKLPEASIQSTEKAELAPLAEAASLLTVQAPQNAREELDPVEVIANGIAETYSTPAMPWESLYPEGGSLKPVNQLLDFFQQEAQFSMPAAQEMGSLCSAEPAELSEVLCQLGNENGLLGELWNGESREYDAETAASEAEPQHEMMQQTAELPEEPLTCVQMPVEQEALFLAVAPPLSEVFESSGETI